MVDFDISKYSSIEEIIADIKSVKIQGATNVARATFEGLRFFLRNHNKTVSFHDFMKEFEAVGNSLAFARNNEPLAKNGVKYVVTMMKINNPGLEDVEVAKKKLLEICDTYADLIVGAKKRIIEKNAGVLGYSSGIFTHCHSSTSESLIIDHVKKQPKTKVICTETRPLFQGRITAVNLVAAGVDTTLIADSGAASVIIGRGTFPVDAVLIGADEITLNGDAINKVGSWGIALAAYYASKPVYVVSSVLKTDVSTVYEKPKIEMREGREIWPEAPLGLKIANPAFDYIDAKFITGYLTEDGLIKPEDIVKVIRDNYEWLF